MQIRDAVLSRELREGDRLPNERELCGLFGVSRPTLREALRALEAHGVVQVKTGSAGGVFVAKPSEQHLAAVLEAQILLGEADARELTEFRLSFEEQTAYWAAQRADKSDVEQLDSIVTQINKAAAEESASWGTFVELDMEFHEVLAHASKNRVRVAIMLGIYRALYRSSLALEPVAIPDLRRSIGTELGRISRAVRAGDGEKAKKLMHHHVARFGALQQSGE